MGCTTLENSTSTHTHHSAPFNKTSRQKKKRKIPRRQKKRKNEINQEREREQRKKPLAFFLLLSPLSLSIIFDMTHMHAAHGRSIGVKYYIANKQYEKKKKKKNRISKVQNVRHVFVLPGMTKIRYLLISVHICEIKRELA